jgi:formylglycine-generating enzyme required for sulfatase activity
MQAPYSLGLKMVDVPGGTFTMGFSGIAEPVHAVTISSFTLGTYELTYEQWADVKEKAEALDAFDISGNVWEWLWDWKADHTAGAQSNPTGASSGYERLQRGGAWENAVIDCECSSRSAGYMKIPQIPDAVVGFRIARGS